MHILITLSGEGRRFIQAGYRCPKFLMEIDKHPIIEHLVHLFPGEKKITFICRPDLLEKTDLRELLQKIAPSYQMLPVLPHQKGPVYSIVQRVDCISDEEELVINYCDFSMGWNYNDFLQTIRNYDADGAIVAYRGFHPHLPGTTNYAFLRAEQQIFLEAREKVPFTTDPYQEYISTGTYYFKRGDSVKKYFPKLLELPWDIQGEYYVSLVYNLMQQEGLKTILYEVPYMLQWGTPRDVEAYRFWSDYFGALKHALAHEVVVPPLLDWKKYLNAIDPEQPVRISWGSHGILWNPPLFELFRESTNADFILWSFRQRTQTSFPIQEEHLSLKIDSSQTIVSFLSPTPLEQIQSGAFVDTKVWYFRQAKTLLSMFSLLETFPSEDPQFFFSLGNLLLEKGFKGKIFEVDFYCPLGTFDLYRTFCYWQKFFNRRL
ncbi:MAG: hypothetical protein AABZ60_01335 [Planctomycetota bacterium]